jgi:endoglucanase
VIGQGSVTPSGGTYTSGTAVSITANPAAGYQFDEWTGDASGTSVSTTITMSADKSVTASFSQIPTTTYTLSTSVTGQGSISTDPPASGGVYAEGTVVSLTATPASGYQFDGWSGALSGNINPGSITMNSNKSVTATFEENGTPGCDNPVTISIPFVQNGSGTYCWVTTTEMAYINSWNLNSLIINGLDFTNTWSYNLPAAQNGQWFIEYDASFGWSHFEAPQAKSSYDKAVIEGTQGISIFPNPFTSEFQVNFSRETGVSLIEVMDMTGKIVFRKTPGGKYSEIAIGADLQPGNYLLRVTTTDEVFTTIVRKK